jgi:hypothetical protein
VFDRYRVHRRNSDPRQAAIVNGLRCQQFGNEAALDLAYDERRPLDSASL